MSLLINIISLVSLIYGLTLLGTEFMKFFQINLEDSEDDE